MLHTLHCRMFGADCCKTAKATLDALDLEGDFDPQEFDRQMAAIYDNDELYDDQVG